MFLILALGIAACGSGVPTVSTVSVSGPAGNALKIGEAVQFSAVAKDTAGKEMTDKTFTWASSDSNIASVDTSGKVTAKRFGKVKISASVDSKTGESAEQTTFGLEASGGVSIYKQGEAPSMALLVRFRNAQDTGVVQNTTALTIKGPTGWNNNTPAQVQYSGNGRLRCQRFAYHRKPHRVCVALPLHRPRRGSTHRLYPPQAPDP
jgi:hypothetical protein